MVKFWLKKCVLYVGIYGSYGPENYAGFENKIKPGTPECWRMWQSPSCLPHSSVPEDECLAKYWQKVLKLQSADSFCVNGLCNKTSVCSDGDVMILLN